MSLKHYSHEPYRPYQTRFFKKWYWSIVFIQEYISKINSFIKVPFNLLNSKLNSETSVTTKICFWYSLGLISFSEWCPLLLILYLLSKFLLSLLVSPHVTEFITPIIINGQLLLNTEHVSLFLAFYLRNNLIFTSSYIWGESGIWLRTRKF